MNDQEMTIREKLQAFSEDQTAIDDISFADLKNKFSKAMNMSPCPCGSTKEYKFCCKPLWQYVERVFKEKKQEEIGKKSGTRWLFRIGYDRKEGFILDAIDKKISVHEMFEAATVVYNQLLVQITTNVAISNIARMQQQAHEQAQAASVKPKGKSFIGL